MKINFIKSNLSRINHYVELYRRCFSNFPVNRNEIYFDWLYNKNPLGKYIGIDVFDSEKKILIGQAGGIPAQFNYCGENIKVMQAVQVCVDSDYRGKGIFFKLLKMLEQYAVEEKYSMIVGVSNKMATPGWQKSISMNLLCQLDVLLGYGDLGLNNLSLTNDHFYSLWNEKQINWRKKNPYNKVFLKKEKKLKFISPSVFSLFEIFSYVDYEKYNLEFDKKNFNFLPKLFIGLAPEYRDKFYFKIPEFIKPSPLNFIYKDLSKKNIILDKKKCYFSYIDFDAY